MLSTFDLERSRTIDVKTNETSRMSKGKISCHTFVGKYIFHKKITKQKKEKKKEKKNHDPYKHSIVVNIVSFVGIGLHRSIEPTVPESRR